MPSLNSQWLRNAELLCVYRNWACSVCGATSSLQDNVNQFIAACKNGFGMKGGQIFEATDLEDPAHRRTSEDDMQQHQDGDRKIRNVRAGVVLV